jgi:hypothetical protein
MRNATPKRAGSVQPQWHGGHIRPAGPPRQPKSHPGENKIAEQDAERGAGDHPCKDELSAETRILRIGLLRRVVAGNEANQDQHDGQVVEHQPEKRVDVSRARPSVPLHLRPPVVWPLLTDRNDFTAILSRWGLRNRQ